ncbi:ABC transporter ATP-binding protein [Streptomyces sp. SID8352]|uniref:ABC transporter ATP-binding protein n=1 Tax=Streptomyces sp. SID8352 TaxID=2690338 RepID=UPI0013697940|nr:ABC transporter ATP-binding protein [Streptomyces sp. SID8352]MYU26313.1 ATP-binding cassette domain-containing protein [Streptomyces sp. SID8352]
MNTLRRPADGRPSAPDPAPGSTDTARHRASPGARVADREVVLGVRGIRTRFAGPQGTVTAVHDVGFDLRRGERLGVVGESGSGKSALARSLMRLIDPPGRVTGGTVTLDGTALHELSERQWRAVRGRDIAMVFQDPMTGFDPLRTIGQQIVEAIRLHQDVTPRQARSLAVDLLGDVEIPDARRRADDHPHQFSGGMRQRAMIAMALANGPRVLIADEPTTALDVTTQASILKLLCRLSDERGTAIIMITHDLGVVAELCDTVQVMYAGRIVERGPAAEVLTRPRHRYTAALLDSVVRRDRLRSGALPMIPGSPPDLAALPAGCPFAPRCATGHDEADCLGGTPESRGVPTGLGDVTVACHLPVDHTAPTGKEPS